MSSLGTGFIRPTKEINKIRYFDKDTFLTLGNGDKFSKDQHHPDNGLKDDDEILSEFLSIFSTLIFFTDPSECNHVLVLTKKQSLYGRLLCELFPDYIFMFTEQITMDSKNHKIVKSKSYLKRKKDIIFVDDILKYHDNIVEWEPYLAMGCFRPKSNSEFFDGILLRPVMGNICRLIIKGIAYRTWNKKNFCRLVNYHIQKVRQKYKFYDPVLGEDIVDYDTAGYRYIILEYLKKVNLPNGDIDNVHHMIEQNIE